MKIRALHRLLAATVIGLFSIPAIAQYTRDASANQKIDEAINNHYLMMELDKAENLLTGTVDACDDKCSPETKAKAWMYVGIVRGSGKQDQAGAAEAFSQAKAQDPNVSLDADLASDETKATFAGTSAGEAPAVETKAAAPAVVATQTTAPGAAPPPSGSPGDMLCSPQGATIGTNMPIPVSCSSNADVSEGFIKFQEAGGADWKKITLENKAGQWQATIPCEFTSNNGELKFYVGVKNRRGEYVDQFGSKNAPATITIGPGGVAPAYPGEAPVSACVGGVASASDCPPDFPGCSSGSTAVCGDLDWGASCSNSSQCKCGLLCESGQCATAPTCSSDSECDTGACVDGYCSALADTDKNQGPFKRHHLSFTAGMDIMPYGGAQLCTADRYTSYGIRCYSPNANGGVDRVSNREDVGTQNGGVGFTPGQMRLKLGYDFAVTHHFTVGARLGLAFLNTRPKPDNYPAEGSFFPLHLAVRAGWTFTSLSKAGFRPVLYLEAGGAESDGHVKDHSSAEKTRHVDMYKVGGFFFAAPGVTLGYAIQPNMSVNLDVQYMLLFPSGGMAGSIHPALSFVYGL